MQIRIKSKRLFWKNITSIIVWRSAMSTMKQMPVPPDGDGRGDGRAVSGDFITGRVHPAGDLCLPDVGHDLSDSAGVPVRTGDRPDGVCGGGNPLAAFVRG